MRLPRGGNDLLLLLLPLPMRKMLGMDKTTGVMTVEEMQTMTKTMLTTTTITTTMAMMGRSTI